VAIHGTVELTDDGLEPEVPLTVLNVSGDDLDVRSVVDTGFTGELTLPEEHIRELGYPYGGSADGTLADGSERLMHFYYGRVLWHGREREIVVVAAKGQPLTGMELLSGSRLTVDATPGGEVAIEEL
jgi:clan AA aspartic protease